MARPFTADDFESRMHRAADACAGAGLAGLVVTPGPGRFGVRIEDIVTVTDTGGQRFNDTPHELGIVT